MDDVTLEEGLKLFSFPKEIGEYENKKLIIGQGRYGPYVKWGEEFFSIPRSEDAHSVDIERAKQIIAAKQEENAPVGYYKNEPYTKGK
jgi:DNA topoisomerase-1